MENINTGLNTNQNQDENTNNTDSEQGTRLGFDQAIDSIIGLFAHEITHEREKAGMAWIEPHSLAIEIRQRLKDGILGAGPQSTRKYGGLF